MRTVRTASGATAMQIVHSPRRGARDIEHLGSAHDEAELEALKAGAAQRLAAGHGELDLVLAAVASSGLLETPKSDIKIAVGTTERYSGMQHDSPRVKMATTLPS
jgi:hypothetical protein